MESTETLQTLAASSSSRGAQPSCSPGRISTFGVWSSKLDKQEAIISGFCSARGLGYDKMVNAKFGMPSLLNLGLLPGGKPEAGRGT